MRRGTLSSEPGSAPSETFYTPQEDDHADGMGTPPPPDGQDAPPLPLLTSGIAPAPSNQGSPPAPINNTVTGVQETLGLNESTLPNVQEQKTDPIREYGREC